MDSVNISLNKQVDVPICFSMSAASSGEARGMTPGSEKLVRKSVAKTKMKSKAPTTGMAGVTSTARNGQLQKKIKIPKINQSKNMHSR